MKNQRFFKVIGFLLLSWILCIDTLYASDVRKYRIVVLDKEQHSVVPDASLTVYDERHNPVKVTQAVGEFIVYLPDEGDFTINVSADEYQAIEGKLLERAGPRIIEVLLTRRVNQPETQTVAFIAKDAVSKLPIGAHFRINSSETQDNTSPTVTTAAHPEFGTELKMNHRYLLKVSAEDYEEFTASIMIKEREPEPITPRIIFLKPLLYGVSFTVRDGAAMQYISPTRFLITENGKDISVKLEGSEANAILRAGKDYDIRVETEGYEPFERTLKFRMPTELRELNKTILMVPVALPDAKEPVRTIALPGQEISVVTSSEQSFENLKVGETIQLKNVYFDQSSYILRPESSTQLDKLASTLLKNPKLKIEIGGHTDNVGDERLNLFLSENRAKVISSYLVNRGITERQLLWKGYGQSKPIAPNDSEENKAKNRRVEFVVLEN